jgi:uncharacterized membrane protein (UPF0127 family)
MQLRQYSVSRLAAMLLLPAALLTPAALAQTQAPRILLLPSATLTLQTQTGAKVDIEAELASTPASRAQGLMYRERMPANHGMLFVFEGYASCFWMRNTLLPLSVAFIDEQGVITRIAHMQPLSDAEHCPDRPSVYALEMNQGWFERNGLAAGDRVNGLPVRAPR